MIKFIWLHNKRKRILNEVKICVNKLTRHYATVTQFSEVQKPNLIYSNNTSFASLDVKKVDIIATKILLLMYSYEICVSHE